MSGKLSHSSNTWINNGDLEHVRLKQTMLTVHDRSINEWRTKTPGIITTMITPVASCLPDISSPLEICVEYRRVLPVNGVCTQAHQPVLRDA